MSKDFDPMELLSRFTPEQMEIFVDAEECERDLATFFRRAWPAFDPSSYMHNWHVDAIADHLMAVSDGGIPKLLINVPPRTSKTSLCSVSWPAWIWAQRNITPMLGPQVRFMCLSFAGSLALEIATTSRRLIASEWYQKRWGDHVIITKDQDNKEKFDTTAGGSRISIGFGGGTPGRGSNIRIIDDPHKVDEVEGDLTRESVLKTYDEALATRDNDPANSAEVIIMQRLHTNDLSGHVLDKFSGHVHLMLPMSYEPSRHCHTVLGWDDPRGLDDDGDMLAGIAIDGSIIPNSPLAKAEGKLMWGKRFAQEHVDALAARLGPYAFSGQMQQLPTPRGGGIIKGEWWKLWNGGSYPDFRHVLVSVDTAQTEKEQNDEAGITVWGVFEGDGGLPQIMLINAWEGRLEFNPLVMKIAEFCRNHKADTCLIEAKSNGIDVINEIRRLFGRREWSTLPFDPGNRDKVARLYAVQSQFSGDHKLDPVTGKRTWIGGIVWAPDKDFAQMAIDRVAAFPKIRQKAITDTVSQAMKWMRDGGLVLTHEEHLEDIEEEMKLPRRKKAAYDV